MYAPPTLSGQRWMLSTAPALPTLTPQLSISRATGTATMSDDDDDHAADPCPWAVRGKPISEDLAWRVVYKRLLLDVNKETTAEHLLISVSSVKRIMRNFRKYNEVI